jgi:hypothetical protein
MTTFDNIDAIDGNMDCFLMADGTNCQKPIGYAFDVLKLRKATREYDACVQGSTTGVAPCVKPVGYDLDLLKLRPASKAYDLCLASQGTMMPPPIPDATTPITDGSGLDTRSASGGQSGLSTGAIVGIVAGGVLVLGTIAYLVIRNKK